MGIRMYNTRNMNELYLRAEEIMNNISELISDSYDSWDHAFIIPYSHPKKENDFSLECGISLYDKEGNKIAFVGLAVENEYWKDREFISKQIRKDLNTKEFGFDEIIVLTSRKEKFEKYLKTKNVRIVSLKKNLLNNYVHPDIYLPAYEYDEPRYLFIKDEQEKELSLAEVVKELGEIVNFPSYRRHTETFFKSAFEGVLENSIRPDKDGKLFHSIEEFEFETKITDYFEPELQKFLCRRFKCDELGIKTNLKTNMELAWYKVLRDNGELGPVFISFGDDKYINIQDIINPVTNSYYRDFSRLHQNLSPHLMMKENFVLEHHFNDVDFYLHLFTDIVDILEVEKPSEYYSLRINFTRLVENMRAFEENLRSCIKAEEELVLYDVEDPKEDFLPVIQMRYVNSVRNLFNSWYSLMGSIASIYPQITEDTPGKRLADHEVKKQLATYKERFMDVMDEQDFDILEATRIVRSKVISHPKGIKKPYSWLTTAWFGVASVCFYTEGIGGIQLHDKYIKSVEKFSEKTTEFPVEIGEDELWELYFPIYHPLLIYKATLNLLEAMFLNKIQDSSSGISQDNGSVNS